MVNIRIYGYSDTLLVIFSMRVCSQNSGTYCMVPSDWDLALTCICGPNFRSNSSENSPDFLFVCLFVWLNKTRTVKPLRRFHSWSSIFTQDGLAFSTKTARRVLQERNPLPRGGFLLFVTNDVIFLSNCFGWNPKVSLDSYTECIRPSPYEIVRIVTLPGVQEELRENGVETEKNRDKSSNCDVCVTCDDVRCLL